ncbi:iron transporter [Robbsia sp. KACC 23696]|uniref:iron transporter n=1 Tax=Robbsia sp. KACC 23696 TaxID=3149231 RepID=UPI00325AB711
MSVNPSPAPRSAPSSRPGGVTLRYRVAVLARTIAAVGGGYGCAALAATCIARWPGAARGDAVGLGMALSFAVMVCVVIGVFAARSAMRACISVAVLAAALFALLSALR